MPSALRLGRINEPLRSPAANIAAEDVTSEQLARIEGGAAALGDTLRGFRLPSNTIRRSRWLEAVQLCGGRQTEPPGQSRSLTRAATRLIPETQEANAFCLSLSNSSWVMAPLSSRFFADAICSAGLLRLATDWMYWSVAT